MKIVFMGTPDVAAQALDHLAARYPIVSVVCQPDRPKGRGLVMSPPPVKVVAQRRGLEVLQPQKTRDEAFLLKLKSIAPDLIVVVAYGGLLTRAILAIPPLGSVNLHSSLLPKYRGATPVQWALMNGEIETGWTTFYLDERMDSGDIISQKKIAVNPNEHAESLMQRMIPLGIELLDDAVQKVIECRAGRVKQQDQEASFAPKLKKEDGLINWNQPSGVILNRIRGLIPWPVAYTYMDWKGHRKEFRVFEACPELKGVSAPGRVQSSNSEGLLVGTSDGGVWLKEVQIEGGRRMGIGEFLRGHPIAVGTILR